MQIDDFEERGSIIRIEVALDEPDSYWWNPYAFQPGRYPGAAFKFTEGCLGGQRDIVLGWEGFAQPGTVGSAGVIVTGGEGWGNMAFSLGFIAGVYFQYDGPDAPNDTTAPLGDTGSAVDPGFLFSPLPGIGAHNPADPSRYPGRNADGQTYDLTYGGRVAGFEILVEGDWSIFYYIDVIDAAGFNNSMEFFPEEDTVATYYFRFDDPGWVTNSPDAGGFDWTRVSGIQIRIWVFSDEENPGEQDTQAVDSRWTALWTWGYSIAGQVVVDCGCDNTADSPYPGIEVSVAPVGGSVILNTFTDSEGRFLFESALLDEGQYEVCTVDTSLTNCQNSPRCRTVTLSIANPDVVNVNFFILIESVLTPPPDQVINCGDCETTAPECLGAASLRDCSGANIPVTTYVDSPRTGCQTVTFTRTFTASGMSVTQTITINDNEAPVITVPAADASVECPNQSPTFASWRTSRGGAQATDCSGVVWTDDYVDAPLSCGSVTVTFIATDSCGTTADTSRTTATYFSQDTIAPTIVTQASSPTAACNANGSDLAQFNTWLNSNGNAQATDNCGSVTWSNDYVEGSLVSGCNNQAVVTFTACDICGNCVNTQGTFVIQDTAGPTITTPAQSQSRQCGAGDITTEYNNWVASNGGAVATDICSGTALTWVNNAPAAPSGCTATSDVTFTVTDQCGNSATTTAGFTVVDNTPPVINPPASPISISCDEANGDAQLNDWVNNNGGAVATDACSGVTWSNDFGSTSAGCNAVPVTFTATDGCNNVARTTTTYSIVDNSPPTITVFDQAVECVSYTPEQFTSWLNSYTVTDNCVPSDQIPVSNDYTGQPPAPGCDVRVTVGWTARDVCGNSSPRTTATFSISDNIPPVFTTTAQDENVPCGPNANTAYTTWLNNRGGATATDSCGAVTWTHNGPTTPQFDGCQGSTVVTWIARDSCGLEISTTATFRISDNEGPVLTTPASPLSEECVQGGSSGLTSWLNRNGGAVATDACSGVTWSNDYTSTNQGCNAATPVTFTATDACGFTVSTTADFTISDTTPPSVTPARDTSAPCDDNTRNALLEWGQNHGGAVATDACFSADQLVWSPFTAPPIVGCNFAEVTFTVTDPCGNSASTTATFTSTDSTPPSFNPPALDAEVECDGAGNDAQYQAWLADHAGSRATDDCALTFTWSNNGPATAPATCGAVTVTFTVVDSCDNSARTTATFRVVDTQPPTITTPPADRTVECDGTGNQAALSEWLASYGGAQATDLCATTLTWSHAAQPETTDGCNIIYPYVFTVRDACGNDASATANFRLGDNVPPVWECPVEDVEFECDGFGNQGQVEGWLNNNGGGHVIDACHGDDITWSHNFVGPIQSCSSATVTFVATDPCGNSVSDTGVVAIVDTEPPTWSFFPDDVTLPCDADVTVAALGGDAVATDVCAGDIPVSMSETEFDEPADGNCPGDHVITRTWTAVDECGNSVSRDQVITVEIVRSSGPCRDDCVCDDCCPPPAPADCLPTDCQPADCARVPCTAAPCSCGNSKLDVDGDESIAAYDAKMVESLPQCLPVYIYVNDDDDSEKDIDSTGLERQRMLVTNEPLHESVLKSKSDASSLSYSVFALVFALALFFF